MMLNQDVTTAWDGLPSEGLQVQVLCLPDYNPLHWQSKDIDEPISEALLA